MSTVQEIEAAIARLTPTEMKSLAAWLAEHTDETDRLRRTSLLRKARGMWRSRRDLPDVRSLRREFDRF